MLVYMVLQGTLKVSITWYVCMNPLPCIHANTHKQTRMHAPTHMHGCMHTHTHARMHACTHTCTDTRTHGHRDNMLSLHFVLHVHNHMHAHLFTKEVCCPSVLHTRITIYEYIVTTDTNRKWACSTAIYFVILVGVHDLNDVHET